MTNLKVNIGSLTLNNPVMVASGTFGYGEEFAELYDIARLGAVVTKGISLKPRQGNSMPRVIETPSGLINAIGLENVGLEAFIREKLPFLAKADATVIVNIFGETVDEYVEVARALSREKGVHGLELNISCPNVAAGGMQFGGDALSAAKLTRAVRKVCTVPLIVKLSPMVGDIAAIAKAVEAAGADAISAINTIPAMAIDAAARAPVLANVVGGLSGPAIKPVALRLVWLIAQSVDMPVIGIGGIMDATDAVEFFIAGASAVQIGTASFVSPTAAIDIIDGLTSYAERQGIDALSDIVGSLAV